MPIDRTAAANAIDSFLRAIGRDPAREPDLAGTGARVAEAYVDELCRGYAVDTRALLASSVIDDVPSPGLVVVRDVPVTTVCPHHLLPATGTATVALLARSRIIGLGAIAALVDAHARRLTLQERIGADVASDLEAVLAPEWVACRLLLTHGCMTARGEHALGSRVETVAFRGPDASRGLAHEAVGVGR
ncbi:MAG: cyclohydrolase [Labilithrix sp.]|nr:cyclohydrolase [Labilithrix sp.]